MTIKQVDEQVKQLHEDAQAYRRVSNTSRFLFVNIAAMRAKQLYRGVQPRLEANDGAALERGTAERIAMEEVRSGLVEYTLDVP